MGASGPHIINKYLNHLASAGITWAKQCDLCERHLTYLLGHGCVIHALPTLYYILLMAWHMDGHSHLYSSSAHHEHHTISQVTPALAR